MIQTVYTVTTGDSDGGINIRFFNSLEELDVYVFDNKLEPDEYEIDTVKIEFLYTTHYVQFKSFSVNID